MRLSRVGARAVPVIMKHNKKYQLSVFHKLIIGWFKHLFFRNNRPSHKCSSTTTIRLASGGLATISLSLLLANSFVTLAHSRIIVNQYGTTINPIHIGSNSPASSAINVLLESLPTIKLASWGVGGRRPIKLDKLSPVHNIEPDAYLDPPEFIRSRHFIPEVHHVITKDQYILTMHRIINPLVPQHLRSKLKPVLLQHGLFTSSFNFIISSDRNTERPRFDPRDLTRTWPLNVYTPQPPFSWHRLACTINDLTLARLGLTDASDRMLAPHVSDSMAFEMANQGYDVWMGNSRGSHYSLNHTRYDHRHDWRYWDFSFHEIGLYDLPAEIDYILGVRQRRSLAYVGHSQGNLAMFILQSLHPEWSNKVKPFIAMAPIVFIPHVYYGSLRLAIRAITSTIVSTTRVNELVKGQVLPNSLATARALDLVCVPKWSTPICDLALTLATGNSLKRANQSLTPVVAHHIPEGTSLLNILHFGQMIESGQFRSFDFGPRENLRRYGTPINPFYPIGNINSTDIAFIVGRTDALSTMHNVGITKSMLRVKLMDDYVVPEPAWGHADYMYANGAGRLANAHIIGLVDRYRLVDNYVDY